jgi:hypothetical protein
MSSLRLVLMFLFCSLVSLFCSCGGGGSAGIVSVPTPTLFPTATAITTTVPTATAVPTAASRSIRITDVITGSTIAGAIVTVNNQTYTSGSQGTVELSISDNSQIKVSATGYVDRQQVIGKLDTISLIPTAQYPMYRATTNEEGKKTLFRWMQKPKIVIYSKKMDDKSQVDINIIEGVKTVITNDLSKLSQGFFSYNSSEIEIYSGDPSSDSRWFMMNTTSEFGYCQDGIGIQFRNSLSGGEANGQGGIIGNGDHSISAAGMCLVVSKITAIITGHEIGHTLGWVHPQDFLSSNDLLDSIMNLVGSGKNSLNFSQADIDTSIIQIHRAPGNSDPDIDSTAYPGLSKKNTSLIEFRD